MHCVNTQNLLEFQTIRSSNALAAVWCIDLQCCLEQDVLLTCSRLPFIRFLEEQSPAAPAMSVIFFLVIIRGWLFIPVHKSAHSFCVLLCVRYKILTLLTIIHAYNMSAVPDLTMCYFIFCCCLLFIFLYVFLFCSLQMTNTLYAKGIRVANSSDFCENLNRFIADAF